MARPSDLPPAWRWMHGQRSKYVCGCRCDMCRQASTLYARQRAVAIRNGFANPIVSAEPARQHMVMLSQAGVGRRTIHKVCGVGDTTLQEVRAGRKRQIRRLTALKILSVQPHHIAAGAYVPAHTTWQRLQFLLKIGWRRYQIARALGLLNAKALQLGRVQITKKHEELVRRLHRSEYLRVTQPVQILWRYDDGQRAAYPTH